MERRGVARLDFPFPAVVRGKDATGQAFQIETTLRNISTTGLFMRLKREISTGVLLNVVVRFSSSAGSPQAAMALFRGRVVRVESHDEDPSGVAVEFIRHRFI
jgi:hypothetical protein